MKVLQFPLVRITICFVFGILFAYTVKPNLQFVVFLVIIALAMVLLSYFLSKRKPSLRVYFGWTTFILSFLIGGMSLISSIETNNPNHFVHHLHDSPTQQSIEVIINEKLKSSFNSDRYIATISLLNQKKSCGKILINIKKHSQVKTWENGTHLKITAPIYKNKKPTNPNQFDYSKYLENKQIYGQVYTDYHSIKVGSFHESNISFFASKLRNTIISNLEKSHFNPTELHVVAALILGQQQDISKDIIRDYQYAGAVHILSVSGLHVGFVLLFMTFLLKPISNTRRNSFLKLCIVLVSLWSFGILAGLAPSVVRSVTMFSFVAIGLFLRRSVNIYHTLFVSVLLILLVEPFFLFDVGFQLSYLALFFIVWLQPLLYSIWKPKYKVINYFWEIITVSFAAQIGTLPLSLYYFHQFPGLFFVTNIVILPMLSVIMGVGLLVLIMAAFDWIWFPLLKILEGSVWLLNSIIRRIASFEDFILKDIPFSWMMMLCCYLLIFCCIVWIQKPSVKKLGIVFSTIIILQLTTLQFKYTHEKKSEFIVFNKRKNTIITERNGKKVTLYGNDSILKNYKNEVVLKSYLVANFCHVAQKNSIGNLYCFKDKTILVIDSTAVYLENQNPDILLLVNSPKVNLQRLFISFKPKQVVADGSNFKSYAHRWKATCMKEKIPFHDTSEKGFYILN